MDNKVESKLRVFSDFLKPIFLKWEMLRILYNIFLGLFVIVFQFLLVEGYPDFLTLFPVLLIGAILANICYLAGPVVESYIAWLGLKSNGVTVILFAGGVLVSIPCVFVSLGTQFSFECL